MGDVSVECERAWLAMLAAREVEVPKRYGWNIRQTFQTGFAAGFAAGGRNVKPRLYTADDEVRSSGWHGGRG